MIKILSKIDMGYYLAFIVIGVCLYTLYEPPSQTIINTTSREESRQISKYLFHDFLVPGRYGTKGPFYYLEITKGDEVVYLKVNEKMYNNLKNSKNKELIIQFNDYLLANNNIEKNCINQIKNGEDVEIFETIVGGPSGEKPRFKRCTRLITKDNYVKYSVHIAGNDMSNFIKEE